MRRIVDAIDDCLLWIWTLIVFLEDDGTPPHERGPPSK